MSTVSLLQIASPDEESPRERISRVEEMLLQHSGSDLYVLPELWNVGYFSFDRYEDQAESLDGSTVSMGRRTAQRLKAWIHLGSIVERSGGLLHNTAILINPQGQIAQVYRKIHVFGCESLESKLLTPGNRLSVVNSPIGRLASTTCYDLRFPGLWQQLSDHGAEAAIVPAAWPASRREHWRLFSTARAVEHQMWVVAVNSCGRQRGIELGGHSRIVDPSGTVIVECSTDEQVIAAEVEAALVPVARSGFPVLSDRLRDYTTLSLDSGTGS